MGQKIKLSKETIEVLRVLRRVAIDHQLIANSLAADFNATVTMTMGRTEFKDREILKQPDGFLADGDGYVEIASPVVAPTPEETAKVGKTKKIEPAKK